ncbi:unannotated protein [freshwater metagenome]|uniref:Unannotated protein n=1 Tax=freshwater metagenome TaxID=449393 RepID=A0A6J7E3A8_9ZZZZ|nr:hypothetical protein [Actinomycetota bacterium]
MITSLRAAGICLWIEAVLSGQANPDELTHACGSVRVRAKEGSDEDTSLAVFAAKLPANEHVFLVLTRPGDPGPLESVPLLTSEAIQAGCAIALTARSVVLMPTEDSNLWLSAQAPFSVKPPLDIPDALRLLKRTLRETIDDIEALDVAGGRERIEDCLIKNGRPSTPDDWDPRRHELLTMALALEDVLLLAKQDPGGTVSASAFAKRQAELDELERLVRRCIEAAVSSTVREPTA